MLAVCGMTASSLPTAGEDARAQEEGEQEEQQEELAKEEESCEDRH